MTALWRPIAARAASLLLRYPDEEVLAALPVIGDALPGLPAEVAEPLAVVAGHRGTADAGSLRTAYVELFDFRRRASLHLTYHTHGDRRQRGLELVRLKRRFAEAGLTLRKQELPDYLPVLLEFAALAPAEGEPLLAELRAPIELVRSRLHDTESPYAGVLDAIVVRLPKLTAAQAEAERRRNKLKKAAPRDLETKTPSRRESEGAPSPEPKCKEGGPSRREIRNRTRREGARATERNQRKTSTDADADVGGETERRRGERRLTG